MENKLNHLICTEETDHIDSLDQLTINDKTDTKPSNFFKVTFGFKGKNFELGFSLYSNLIFIIVTYDAKLGNIWLAEIEEETEGYLLEEEDNDINFEIKCILGERNNELYRIISSMIVRKLSSIYRKKGNLLKTVLVSLAFRSSDIENTENVDDFVTISDSTKQFIETINKSIESLF